jgi:hypothetical protein
MNEINNADQRVWDFKKITGLAYGFRDQKILSLGEVRGTQASKEQPKIEAPNFTDIQTTFEERLLDIREEAENIDVAEVASSSPQVQKVISDLKNLQNYPRNQAKEACFNICEGL